MPFKIVNGHLKYPEICKVDAMRVIMKTIPKTIK